MTAPPLYTGRLLPLNPHGEVISSTRPPPPGPWFAARSLLELEILWVAGTNCVTDGPIMTGSHRVLSLPWKSPASHPSLLPPSPQAASGPLTVFLAQTVLECPVVGTMYAEVFPEWLLSQRGPPLGILPSLFLSWLYRVIVDIVRVLRCPGY